MRPLKRIFFYLEACGMEAGARGGGLGGGPRFLPFPRPPQRLQGSPDPRPITPQHLGSPDSPSANPLFPRGAVLGTQGPLALRGDIKGLM